jgi:predicted nuclease of predicted toxin-antitoxin system
VERRPGCHSAVRLLLDEMLSPKIAQELRSRGHDVVAVAGDRDHEGLPDPEVMALARAERRAVVTNNLRDYRPLHHEAITPGGPGHYGMIYMPGSYRRTKADAGRIIAVLQTLLDQYPDEADLANGEAWL